MWRTKTERSVSYRYTPVQRFMDGLGIGVTREISHPIEEIESVEVLLKGVVDLKKLFQCCLSEGVQGVIQLRPLGRQWNSHVYLAEGSLSSAEPAAPRNLPQKPRNLPPTSRHLSFLASPPFLLFISNSLPYSHIASTPVTWSFDSRWQVRFLPESIFAVICTCAHTQFAWSSCFLQHPPWEQTGAARRQGVGVDQALMQGLGHSQNVSPP